jgi:hypothetical protein
MNEISTAIVVQDAGSIMSKVIELASAPGTNPEMFDRLVAWQEREQARHALIAYDDAMSAAQAEIQPVVRSAWNDQTKSRHATLDGVDEAIRPIYTKHGFSVSFTEVANDNTDLKLACIVSRSGHSKTFYLPAALDTLGPKGAPNKTQVQGVGSTVSYLRRYLICLAFNVATRDDNDGNRQRPNAGGGFETGELITRPQIAELRALMLETRIMESVVLAKKAPGLATIEALPAAAFHIIRNDLLSRKNVLAQRAANSQGSNGAAA